MTDFNYKKYSLENLENWLHDAMSAGEATPQEIYDTIKEVVEENYYHYKHHVSQAYELLALLNNNGKGHIQAYDDHIHFNTDLKKYNTSDVDGLYMTQSPLFCYSDDSSEECKNSWNSFWEENVTDDNKVIKWQLPVNVDGLTGDCYVNLPDDLLEAAGLKEGDRVEWVDNGNGSYTMRKVK